ncbi:MAG: response regulator [Gammaproteobacteria bacterium]|jgi:FixJ family two-component response regulator|nr:response regulator [Gammaproteobacteria bacterium]
MTECDQSAMVYLVDDDAPVRRALSRLLRSAGLETREFSSGDEFMDSGRVSGRGCVVAESIMPYGAGIDLPRRLRESGREIPVILLTAEANGQRRATAKLAGAMLFFRKPVDGQALVDAVEWALSENAPRRQDPAHTTS